MHNLQDCTGFVLGLWYVSVLEILAPGRGPWVCFAYAWEMTRRLASEDKHGTLHTLLVTKPANSGYGDPPTRRIKPDSVYG